MTWRRRTPGHQQPWYWLIFIPEYSCFSTRQASSITLTYIYICSIMASQIIGNLTVCSTACSTKNKTKTPKLWITVPLWGESTNDWWILLTKWQQCGKSLYVITSSQAWFISMMKFSSCVTLLTHFKCILLYFGTTLDPQEREQQLEVSDTLDLNTCNEKTHNEDI